LNIVVVGHYREDYALGYYLDWRDAFLELRPRHSVTVINTWNRFERPRPIMNALPLSWSFDSRPFDALYSGKLACDLLVYAPSFFYFNTGRRREAIRALAAKGAHRMTTAFFVENEYRRLAEKVEYANDLGARLLVTQVEEALGARFYGERFGGRILTLPPGLNPALYHPRTPIEERPLDVGTRSHRYPPGPIGDRRNAIIDAFQRPSGPLSDLRVDVSTSENARLTRTEWAEFLSRCRATIASEAAGRLRWDDAEEGLSFGAVSSRHYEAIGSKTALLMPAGTFGGRLREGEHYVEVDPYSEASLREAARFVRDHEALKVHTDKALARIRDTETYLDRCHELVRAA